MINGLKEYQVLLKNDLVVKDKKLQETKILF